MHCCSIIVLHYSLHYSMFVNALMLDEMLLQSPDTLLTLKMQ